MDIFNIILACLFIMFASLAGVIFFTKRFEKWTHKNIKYLIAFSAGVFLVVSYGLVKEAFEFGTDKTVVIISIILGFSAFFILEKIYPEVHCHHSDKKCLTENNKKSAKKVLIGDAIHNIGDGILLASVFAIDLRIGIIATIGIFVHEFVQEISEFFVLISAGNKKEDAIKKNFAVSSTILIGAIGGFYLSSFESFVGPLIGLAAGAFIHILIIDLIPDSIRHSHQEKNYIPYLFWVIVGVLIISFVNSFAGSYLEEQGLDSHGHLEIEHSHDEYGNHIDEDHYEEHQEEHESDFHLD